jgi:UDP-glucose 4-epimerase
MKEKFDKEPTPLLKEWAKGIRTLPIRFRLTRIPFIGEKLFKDSFVGDPSTKAWMVPVQEEIDVPDSVHLPVEVVRELIKKSAYRGTMNGCPCRVGFDCQEFPQNFGCLALGNASEEELVPLSVEEALEHADHALEIGLVPTIIWERENQTVFGAEMNKGLAICYCCDCCCDYRLGLRVGNKAFKKKVFRPEGISLVVSDDCVLCGDCAEPDVCSVYAISLGVKKSIIDLDKCVGCSHCVMVCPENAISFVLDPEVDVVGRLLKKVEEYTKVD